MGHPRRVRDPPCRTRRHPPSPRTHVTTCSFPPHTPPPTRSKGYETVSHSSAFALAIMNKHETTIASASCSQREILLVSRARRMSHVSSHRRASFRHALTYIWMPRRTPPGTCVWPECPYRSAPCTRPAPGCRPTHHLPYAPPSLPQYPPSPADAALLPGNACQSLTSSPPPPHPPSLAHPAGAPLARLEMRRRPGID